MRSTPAVSARLLLGLVALSALGLSSSAAQAQQLITGLSYPNVSNAPSTFIITFSTNGQTSATRPLELASLFAGTFTVLPGTGATSVLGSSILMETFADASNALNGTGFVGGSYTFSAPDAASASYTGNPVASGFNPPPAAPFSLSLRYTLKLAPYTSFDGTGSVKAQAVVAAVPEPGEWAAMAILATGLGGLIVRKRRIG